MIFILMAYFNVAIGTLTSTSEVIIFWLFIGTDPFVDFTTFASLRVRPL